METNADHDQSGERLTRRRTIARLGGLVAASLGAAGLEATLSEPAEGAGNGPAGVAAGLVRCVLSPEQTEGPYYVDGERVRRDIREGRAGLKLVLRPTVVDASSCKPIKGASVDIWHCDAGGVYSGVNGNSGTFPPRHPADRRAWDRDVRDALPGLVPGSHDPYPRQGATVATVTMGVHRS